MQRFQMFDTDLPVEFVDERFEAVRGAEIIARGEGVAGIEADADAGVVFAWD